MTTKLKVKCINANDGGFLEYGKVYDVLEVKYSMFDTKRYVVRPSGTSGFPAKFFVVVSGCPCEIKNCIKHRGHNDIR